QYTTIVTPLIRSLWSLEAAHANASDVFIFWLSMAATLKQLFDKDANITGIPRSLATDVTTIYNNRYAEFFRSEIYFAAYLLDPRYSLDDCLKLTISLPVPGTAGSSSQAFQRHSLRTSRYPRAYERLRKYLASLFVPILERVQKSSDPSIGHPVVREMGVVQAAAKFKQEVEQFWNGEYPFRVIDAETIRDPLAWWRDLANYNGAKLLSIVAIKIFSILVNSMPDERTNSTITWFNSPIRGNQSAGTLIDMIQIGQWYGKHDPVSSVCFERSAK
ncbi:hypothetical protein CPC08DRAFT_651083, partial [Agrocybe pediades]